MTDLELYHWLRKGEAADEHKYIRRWWKNGRWNYEYADGTVTESYPKGQNYKTTDQVKTEKLAVKAREAERNKAYVEKQRKIDNFANAADAVINQLISNGRQFTKKLDRLMSTRVIDLFNDK